MLVPKVFWGHFSMVQQQESPCKNVYKTFEERCDIWTEQSGRLLGTINACNDLNLYPATHDDPVTFQSSSKTNMLPYFVLMPGKNIKMRCCCSQWRYLTFGELSVTYYNHEATYDSSWEALSHFSYRRYKKHSHCHFYSNLNRKSAQEITQCRCESFSLFLWPKNKSESSFFCLYWWINGQSTDNTSNSDKSSVLQNKLKCEWCLDLKRRISILLAPPFMRPPYPSSSPEWGERSQHVPVQHSPLLVRTAPHAGPRTRSTLSLSLPIHPHMQRPLWLSEHSPALLHSLL